MGSAPATGGADINGIIIGLVVLAYLVGSIPSGYLLMWAAQRVDVRDYGSHSIGTINVMRVGGLRPALITLVCDVGKVWLVVVGAAALRLPPAAIAACALSALLGHAFSFWLLLSEGHFSEGKCVAGTLGILLGLAQIGVLSWLAAVTPVGVWLLGLFGPRLAAGRWLPLSVATLTAMLSVPVVMWVATPDVAWRTLGVAIYALVLLRHKNNLRRLCHGEEPSADSALHH